jgi:hypothetical protein
MDNKDMRGAIIRGAMAMQTPVIIVFFKECCADNFQANWDDLTSSVQQFWIELAGQLEGIIGSELWKSTIDKWEEPSDCDSEEWSKDYGGKKCKHFGRCNHEAEDDCFEKANPQVKDLCTGCASENCSHMWKWGKKCCPDCSHVKPLSSFEFKPCPYEDKLCPICKLELKPSPSGWSCANGHGY